MICKEIYQIYNTPFYSLSIEKSSINSTITKRDLYTEFSNILSKKIITSTYRAVSFERLENIIKYGVDVYPTDSVIYCDTLEKAMEYGGWPKVVMAFDMKRLQKTFKEVSANIDPNELEKLRSIYPTMEESKDGSKLWLSRLNFDDPRRGSGYEIAYAWWIQASPWDCLEFVLLVGLSEDQIQLKLNNQLSVKQ